MGKVERKNRLVTISFFLFVHRPSPVVQMFQQYFFYYFHWKNQSLDYYENTTVLWMKVNWEFGACSTKTLSFVL